MTKLDAGLIRSVDRDGKDGLVLGRFCCVNYCKADGRGRREHCVFEAPAGSKNAEGTTRLRYGRG